MRCGRNQIRKEIGWETRGKGASEREGGTENHTEIDRQSVRQTS